VALLHRPYDSTAGFDAEDLHTEGQVVILPAGHPLAGRPHVRAADVTALPGLLPRWPDPDGRFPDGPGPPAQDQAQLYQLIALGRASAILPESCRIHLRRDLAAGPVLDAPAVTTVIAWPPHSRSRPSPGWSASRPAARSSMPHPIRRAAPDRCPTRAGPVPDPGRAVSSDAGLADTRHGGRGHRNERVVG
jgi:DNA-binding transcriptional LysR family regulator